eukprot:RCo021372
MERVYIKSSGAFSGPCMTKPREIGSTEKKRREERKREGEQEREARRREQKLRERSGSEGEKREAAEKKKGGGKIQGEFTDPGSSFLLFLFGAHHMATPVDDAPRTADRQLSGRGV